MSTSVIMSGVEFLIWWLLIGALVGTAVGKYLKGRR